MICFTTNEEVVDDIKKHTFRFNVTFSEIYFFLHCKEILNVEY